MAASHWPSGFWTGRWMSRPTICGLDFRRSDAASQSSVFTQTRWPIREHRTSKLAICSQYWGPLRSLKGKRVSRLMRPRVRLNPIAGSMSNGHVLPVTSRAGGSVCLSDLRPSCGNIRSGNALISPLPLEATLVAFIGGCVAIASLINNTRAPRG